MKSTSSGVSEGCVSVSKGCVYVCKGVSPYHYPKKKGLSNAPGWPPFCVEAASSILPVTGLTLAEAFIILSCNYYHLEH